MYVIQAHHGLYDIYVDNNNDDGNREINKFIERLNYDKDDKLNYNYGRVLEYSEYLEKFIKYSNWEELFYNSYLEYNTSISKFNNLTNEEKSFYHTLYVRLFLSISITNNFSSKNISIKLSHITSREFSKLSKHIICSYSFFNLLS